MKKAIFLDRDGTLNKDEGYFHEAEKLEIFPGVIEGLKLLKDDYDFYVIQNQGGIGKGIYSEKEMWEVNNALNNILKKNDMEIKRFYFCPHDKDQGCICRKPSPHMILKAKRQTSIDLNRSWFIGDTTIDSKLVENVRKQGYPDFKMILVKTGGGGRDGRFNAEPDYVAENILEAANIIKMYEK